jgi:hypothetical protein
MDLQVLMHDIVTMEAGAVVVGFHENVRPLKGGAGALDWILCGALSRLVFDRRITGAAGEVALLTNAGKISADKIFMVGLGRSDAPGEERLRKAARAAAASLVRAGVSLAAAELFPLGNGPNDAEIAAVREGLETGAAGRDLRVTLLAVNTDAFERLARPLRT